MSRTANVHSIEALDRFRAALCSFAEGADLSLTMLRLELDRFVDWLEHGQLKYWQQEIRLREDRVGEAKTDLHRCLAATVDADRTPSCYQEKKVLENAKRRLEEAQDKLAAVRRWIPPVRQAVLEFRMKAEPLAGALLADIPKAVSLLEHLAARLAEYIDLAAPSGSPSLSNGTSANSATPALPASKDTAESKSIEIDAEKQDPPAIADSRSGDSP